jgi:hypothetical protein
LHLHTCTHIFAPYSPLYFLCLLPCSSHWFKLLPHCRTCSALLSSYFVKENRKKNSVLLVWEKGNYIGSFPVIFLCVYVL